MIFIDIFASFLIAGLSGMGIGSGGLFAIYLTFMKNAEQLSAQGSNLLFFLFSSGSALIYHMRKRNIYWTAVLFMAVVGIGGAVFGSFIAGIIPTQILRKLFGIMLTLSGIAVLLKKGA